MPKNMRLEVGMRVSIVMKATFRQLIVLRAELMDSPEAYDSWAQREQARVLIEYVQSLLMHDKKLGNAVPQYSL